MPYRWDSRAGRVVRVSPDEEETPDEVEEKYGRGPQGPGPVPGPTPGPTPIPGVAPGFAGFGGTVVTNPASGRTKEILGQDTPFATTVDWGEPGKPERSSREKYQDRVDAFVAINERMPTDSERRNLMEQAGILGPEKAGSTKDAYGPLEYLENGQAFQRNLTTGEIQYRGAPAPRPAAGSSWKPGEYELQSGELEIARGNLALAATKAEDARNQWKSEYDAGREDATTLKAYRDAQTELERAKSDFDRLRLQSEEGRAGEQLAWQKESFGQTMGFNREQLAEQRRQFEAQEQRAREQLAHQKQEDEIRRLFGLAQTTGYVPIALLKMSAPNYLEGFGGIGG